MLTLSSQRHYGMDLVRSFAILTVLIGHALIFFPQFFNVNWLIYLAVFGVELFFALSGFLIGNILIRLNKEEFNFSMVVQFWIKRWMRTIPVYIFIVTIIMLNNQKFYFSYLLFIQNIYPEQLKDFPVSWSLTIEEWFYLSFPLLMYFGNKITKLLKINSNKIVILLSIIVFIVVPFVLRLLEINNNENWDNSIRKQIHMRLDGIGYGILLAYIYNQKKHLLLQYKHNLTLGIFLLIGFIFIWWLFNTYINIFSAKSTLFNNAIFYPLINIYSALFVAYFIRFQKYSSNPIQKIVLFVSLISYSLYLVHFPIYTWFAKFTSSISMTILALIISIICMFVIGTILYKVIEKPCIDLRNKWYSKQTIKTSLDISK